MQQNSKKIFYGVVIRATSRALFIRVVQVRNNQHPPKTKTVSRDVESACS